MREEEKERVKMIRIEGRREVEQAEVSGEVSGCEPPPRQQHRSISRNHSAERDIGEEGGIRG